MTYRREQGAVLITGLVILIILTLLGLSQITFTTIDTRITSNVQDKNVAFQLAESILEEAEAAASGLNPDDFDAGVVGQYVLDDAPNFLGSSEYQVLNNARFHNLNATNAFTSTQTSAENEAGQSATGFYIIALEEETTDPVKPAAFIVTVLGQGLSTSTQVVLQTRLEEN